MARLCPGAGGGARLAWRPFVMMGRRVGRSLSVRSARVPTRYITPSRPPCRTSQDSSCSSRSSSFSTLTTDAYGAWCITAASACAHISRTGATTCAEA